MEVTYMATDSLGALVSQTDTLDALAKVSYEKRQKEFAKELEKWQKEQERKKRREEPYDSIYPVKHLEPQYNASSSMDPDQRVTVEMPTPLVRYDTAAVHLYSKIDSLWYEARCVFRPVEHSLRQFEILADWRPGTEYSLEVDSAAFEDIYGQVSEAYKEGLKIKDLDAYSTLTLNISGIADSLPLRVQLLSSSGVKVKEVLATKGSAHFDYVTPNKYYVCAFVDNNGNGLWDTGDYDAYIQPEAVYYYSREIECKAKWDVTQSWNISATPLYRQKPLNITKQKGDTKQKQKNRNAERAQKLGITYNKEKNIKLED
jgi:hypothetical protein